MGGLEVANKKKTSKELESMIYKLATNTEYLTGVVMSSAAMFNDYLIYKGDVEKFKSWAQDQIDKKKKIKQLKQDAK
jgi:hypothetical protein